MTSRCANDCGGYAGCGFSKCQACRVEENNDFRTAREVRDSEPDELTYECTSCNETYSGTLGDDCPSCGSRRCRYAGALDGEAVTDGGIDQPFSFGKGDEVLVRVREHGTTGTIVAKFEAECVDISEPDGWRPSPSPVARFTLPWGTMESTKLRPHEAEFERVDR